MILQPSSSMLIRAQWTLEKVHDFYRRRGLAPTLLKIAGKVVQKARADARDGHPGQEAWAYHEFGVNVLPVGLAAHPLFAGGLIAQLFETGERDVASFEVLIGRSGGPSRGRLTLLDSEGRILTSEAFTSDGMSPTEYYAARLPQPVRLPGDRRLVVVLESLNGTRGACIVAWRARRPRMRVYELSTADLSTLAVGLANGAPLSGSSRKGSLVVRLRSPRRAAVSYRQPEMPADMKDRVAGGVRRLGVLTPKGPIQKRLSQSITLQLEEYASTSAAREALRKARYDFLLLHQVPFGPDVRELLRDAHELYVPTACYVDAMLSDPGLRDFRRSLDACDFAVCSGRETLVWTTRDGKPVGTAETLHGHTECGEERGIWNRLLCEYHRRFRPKVSIVTVLYNKAAEIGPVLDSYYRQTYEGEIEIIFVDDRSRDDSVSIVDGFFDLAPKSGRLEARVIRNEVNRGNCVSRNIGVREASGDILVIVDADCLLNADFVKRHVEAHAFADCEIVIGPCNIETLGREPARVLKHYEERPELVEPDADLQDRINRSSFLNCVTRNFSIKATAVRGDLFDPLFTYSEDPESGYGWEDVEMGYRLYRDGARIRYVQEAFSVHISPAEEGRDESKPLRSMRNYRRLLEKHPELGWIARRWAGRTCRRICGWADSVGAAPNADRQFLETYFEAVGGPPALKLKRRRYRVLSYRWHVAHQYELYKLPLDVTLLTGLGSPMTDHWDYERRPLPENVRFARFEEIDPRDYDFAVLHFDENVLSPHNTNDVIGCDWGRAFKWLRESMDIPKVAVCHGTPQFHGQYDIEYSGSDLLEVIEDERRRLVDYLADIPVVLNSHHAQREWGFQNSRVIWHGLDPTEFPPATYERGILSPLGPLVLTRPHYRGYFLYRRTFDGGPAEIRPDDLRVPDPHVSYSGNAYAVAKFRNYIDEIRRYTVYFNPTLRSPMPRARCEPMMCGVVTVSANNHDVDMFIRNGVNGFYSNDPDELRQILVDLMGNPGAARQIGAEGRKTAIDLFNHDRYLADWRRVIVDLVS